MVNSDLHFIERLRLRTLSEGRVLWHNDLALGVFDPEAVARLDPENFEGLTIPEPAAFGLGFKKNAQPVFWEEVREAFRLQAGRLNTPESLRALYNRMSTVFANSADEALDLTWFSERALSRPLIYTIINGLTKKEFDRIVRDQEWKLKSLFVNNLSEFSFSERLWGSYAQIYAGLVIRQVLKARVRGQRPTVNDMTQALVPLLGRLGYVRATYAVTTLLTAIAGAPGSVAACLLFELQNHPEWREAIESELRGITEDEICSTPFKLAQKTYQFIRETLRLWSFPLAASRVARKNLAVAGHVLSTGQPYIFSAYITHRDPAYWTNPEIFDPERWSRRDGGAPSGAYVPFGWRPRTCVGANVGLSALFIFCHLLATRVSLEIDAKREPAIKLGNVAVPENFFGRLVPRTFT